LSFDKHKIHLVRRIKGEQRMIAGRPMPIHRSWLRTLAWALAALALFAGAAFLGYSHEYLIAGFMAIFAVGAVAVAGSGSYLSECPVCGTQLRGLLGLTRCPQCLRYGQVTEGAYYELQPDYVNKAALLAFPLREGREMPALCCACGAPAARAENLRIIRLEFAFDLDVPHCGLHTHGADLDSEPIAGKGRNKALAPVLKVKSYAFYQACLKANYPANDRRAMTTHA
jgi:hypothetical protein